MLLEKVASMRDLLRSSPNGQNCFITRQIGVVSVDDTRSDLYVTIVGLLEGGNRKGWQKFEGD